MIDGTCRQTFERPIEETMQIKVKYLFGGDLALFYLQMEVEFKHLATEKVDFNQFLSASIFCTYCRSYSFFDPYRGVNSKNALHKEDPGSD